MSTIFDTTNLLWLWPQGYNGYQWTENIQLIVNIVKQMLLRSRWCALAEWFPYREINSRILSFLWNQFCITWKRPVTTWSLHCGQFILCFYSCIKSNYLLRKESRSTKKEQLWESVCSWQYQRKQRQKNYSIYCNIWWRKDEKQLGQCCYSHCRSSWYMLRELLLEKFHTYKLSITPSLVLVHLYDVLYNCTPIFMVLLFSSLFSYVTWPAHGTKM